MSVLVLVPGEDVNVRVLAVRIDPCASVLLIVVLRGAMSKRRLVFRKVPSWFPGCFVADPLVSSLEYEVCLQSNGAQFQPSSQVSFQ